MVVTFSRDADAMPSLLQGHGQREQRDQITEPALADQKNVRHQSEVECRSCDDFAGAIPGPALKLPWGISPTNTAMPHRGTRQGARSGCASRLACRCFRRTQIELEDGLLQPEQRLPDVDQDAGVVLTDSPASITTRNLTHNFLKKTKQKQKKCQ